MSDLGRSIFIIFSPAGTSAGGGYSWHTTTSEVADLCGPDGNLNLTTGSFPVTSIWSNQDSGCVIGD